MADNKSPWGGGDSGSNDGSGESGPRNPWAQPPSGRPRGAAGPSALDEFLKRARGGGNGSGGGGRPHLPGTPNAGTLWLIGVLIILFLWIALSSFHVIGPQQRGVVTFFGRYSQTLDPGLRMTLPAPFSTVQKVDVSAITTDTFPDGGTGPNLMLTGDQNIVDLDYSVRWNIKNPQDFAFQIKDPKATLRATAESTMRAVIATTSLDEAIGKGRDNIDQRVQQGMQDILDSYNSGIRIEGVAIKGAQAPAEVADSFKKVSAAEQNAQTNISQARGYAQQIRARAEAEAASFNVLYTQYQLAPEVTRRRMYYETMEEVLARSDKTIVEAPGVVPYLPLPGGTRAPATPPVTVGAGAAR